MSQTRARSITKITAGDVLVLVVAGMTARLSPNVNCIGAKLRAAVRGLAHGEQKVMLKQLSVTLSGSSESCSLNCRTV